MNKMRVAVAILLVFMLGVLAGTLGSRLYTKYRITRFVERGHEARAELLLQKLTHELDLTEVQRSKIGAILRNSQEKLHRVDKKYRPEIKKVIDEDFRLIKELLNDEQQKKLDLFFEKFKKRKGHKLFPSHRLHHRGQPPS